MSLIDDNFIIELTQYLMKIPIPTGLESHEITEKSRLDYVTKFDLDLDGKISSFIKKKFPQHMICSEENIKESLVFDQPTWVLDPLDGTSNFMFQIPFFCTSIAFIDKNCVQFGIVYDFSNGDTFYAKKGFGSYLNGEKLSEKRSVPSEFIGLSSGFIDLCIKKNPRLISALRSSAKLRILGSQALSLCYVASGRLKANINYEAKIWDDLAGSLILEEASCHYESLNGFKPNDLNTWESQKSLFSLASNKKNKDTLLSLLS